MEAMRGENLVETSFTKTKAKLQSLLKDSSGLVCLMVQEPSTKWQMHFTSRLKLL